MRVLSPLMQEVPCSISTGQPALTIKFYKQSLALTLMKTIVMKPAVLGSLQMKRYDLCLLLWEKSVKYMYG